jgi:DNA repair protein RadC
MTKLSVSDAVRAIPSGSVVPTARTESFLPPLARLLGPKAAKTLLLKGGVTGLARMRAPEIAAIAGSTVDAAERLVAAREIGLLLARKAADRMTGPIDIGAHVPAELGQSEVEMIFAVALDGQLDSLGTVLLARGGRTGASIELVDVFTPLVRLRAHAFVLVHNHPSGTLAPSNEDVVLTNRVAEAGALLCIKLLDHIIVARGGAFSFYDHDLLPTAAELKS